MTNLTRAYKQLFSRSEDERFGSIDDLLDNCRQRQESAQVKWVSPHDAFVTEHNGELKLKLYGDTAYGFNEWSFGQACQLADVRKETINRLLPATAAQVLYETMPNAGQKPLQIMTDGNRIRSLHGVSYTRLYDAEVLEAVLNEATGFAPPPPGINGGTGMYAGEQDMFAFLIDDDSWVDIGGEQFAPGFFVWNSEVGRRTVGLETFWYQRICANHIVWDATEVASYSRKHTSNVGEALGEIRLMLRNLVRKRDERKDAFAKSIQTAMTTPLGDDVEKIIKVLSGAGIRMSYVREAIDTMSLTSSKFTVFQAVDALTRITGKIANAGERAEQDAKVGRLLALAV